MIKLSDGCYVAAEDIGEVSVCDMSRNICVRTKNGIGHFVRPDHGKSAYASADRLVAEINDALSKERPFEFGNPACD